MTSLTHGTTMTPYGSTLRSRSAATAYGAAVVMTIGLLIALETDGHTVTYERLIDPAFAEPAPDPVFGPERHEYAATHALLLSAAVHAEDEEAIDESRAWLLSAMTERGWQLPWAWDAFGDGTVNPPGAHYSITTALALDGLLDAGIATEEMADVLVRWASDHWTETSEGGYYWFSTLREDAKDVPNVSAMLAGVGGRMAREYPHLFDTNESRIIRERADAAFSHLAATASESSDYLQWTYSSDQVIPNDLGHHGYIIWGGERHRDAGGRVPWTRKQALSSLEQFWRDSELGVYPAESDLTPDMAARMDSPWTVFGRGMALAILAAWGDERDAGRARQSLETALTVRTSDVPRFTAHALLALAIADASPSGR